MMIFIKMHMLHGLICDQLLVAAAWCVSFVIYNSYNIFSGFIYVIFITKIVFYLMVSISELLQFMGPRYPAGPRPGVRMPQMGNDFNGVCIIILLIY